MDDGFGAVLAAVFEHDGEFEDVGLDDFGDATAHLLRAAGHSLQELADQNLENHLARDAFREEVIEL